MRAFVSEGSTCQWRPFSRYPGSAYSFPQVFNGFSWLSLASNAPLKPVAVLFVIVFATVFPEVARINARLFFFFKFDYYWWPMSRTAARKIFILDGEDTPGKYRWHLSGHSTLVYKKNLSSEVDLLILRKVVLRYYSDYLRDDQWFI